MSFINKFLAIFGSNGNRRQTEMVVEYQGFYIQPTPNNANGGWSTEALISKEIDGEIKTHHFIRADTNASKQGAIELILAKTRIIIDQSGEQLFTK